jgi:PAS domain-containing protein
LAALSPWRFNEIAFARTKLILDCAGEGIFGLDPEGKITFINPAAEKMLRLDPSASIGKQLGEILRHNSADSAAFAADAEPILAPLGDRISRNGSDEIFWRNDGTVLPGRLHQYRHDRTRGADRCGHHV